MNRLSRIALTLSLALASLTAASAYGPNVVVNGSFEAPARSFGTWGIYGSIPGWTTVSGSGMELQNHVAGLPYDGAQHIELDGNNSSAIVQTVPTVPGLSYTFSFAYSPRPGVGPNGIEASWNGAAVHVANANGIGNPNTQWQVISLTVVATGPTSTISFRDLGPSDTVGGYIDDVQLELATFDVVPLYKTTKAHPTPSTIPIKLQLWGLGTNLSAPDLFVTAVLVADSSSNTYPVVDSGNSNASDLFRYDADLQGYIFNLKTNGMAPGDYTLFFTTSDSAVVFSVPFKLK